MLNKETKISFGINYGRFPGKHIGIIKEILIPNPHGFFPDGRSYYDVKVWISLGYMSYSQMLLVDVNNPTIVVLPTT